MKKDSLGTRMKGYESVSMTKLMPRMPMILRIDGRAFHSMVKKWHCVKPFDFRLMTAMMITTHALCEEIQGAKLGYSQSDEISILVTDYDTLTSGSFFEKKIQKICSVVAAIATKVFNFDYAIHDDLSTWAEFDCRAFILPKEEVTNYFIWRQQDATRNSIQMAARSQYSHKQCNNKNCVKLQDMLMDVGINWNDYCTNQKRGFCVRREEYGLRRKWMIDSEIPIFTEDRNYVEKYV